MLLNAERLLELIENEIVKLCKQNESESEVSSISSTLAAVRLLLERERQGNFIITRQFEQLTALLNKIALKTKDASNTFGEALAHIQIVTSSLGKAGNLSDMEENWRRAVSELEALSGQLRAEPGISLDLHSEIIQLINEWEIADLTNQLPEKSDGCASIPYVSSLILQAYLRDRFKEQDLSVIFFKALPGGFGKETYLFDVKGKALNGSFVMRRDFPVPLVNGDCHLIYHEYEVIKTLYKLKFPAPDAVFLDTEHKLIPGGDFIIMSRSPGIAGGTALGSKGQVPLGLANTLASILGRLHSLPPLDELANLNESINGRLWHLPIDLCVQKYLQSWMTILTLSPHLPSPSLMSMLGWLLDNIPESSGNPVLVHGDIGFHNFLFDDGELTAVLDWEFAHIGDPAEDLAKVRSNLGCTLDWNQFMTIYREAGGQEIAEDRIRFFQIWGYIRDAICSMVSSRVFLDGHADDIKFVITPHRYVPYFIGAAKKVMMDYPTQK